MTVPEIFDRHARRLRRTRAVRCPDRFLSNRMADDLLERLDLLATPFEAALVIGVEPALLAGLDARAISWTACEAAPQRAALAGALVCEEDALPFAPARFDLVVSTGCLDTVSDLPGALIAARRCLRPGGRFLANFAGSPGLATLASALSAANDVRRIHPAVDVRGGGDLLMRAGFVEPVADIDSISLSYTDLRALVRDLRAAGATNVLRDRTPVDKAGYSAAITAFASAAEADGRTREMMSLITCSARAP